MINVFNYFIVNERTTFTHTYCRLCGIMTRNLDLSALKLMSYYAAKSSQMVSTLRVALGVGAINTISSA